FNPTTKIRFEIPGDGLVKLKVYNILGQEVATLVDKPLLAGRYAVDFDGSNLSSGVYIYRISANGFTESKKMILTK
ncbi:MAG: peptidase S8, partial [Phototrophicales bacterium]